MKRVTLRAPAKVNLTFEVLGRRPDGYHDIRSVLATVDLADAVELQDAAALALEVRGGEALAAEPPDTNLAYRAAQLLREEVGEWRGAAILLAKQVPVAAGLGGGSSDAAAVLRGLNLLWEMELAVERLESLAAKLGSDVPFFLHGGVALVSGRGARVGELPDLRSPLRLLLFSPERAPLSGKTAAMYAHLGEEAYAAGPATDQLVARLAAGGAARDSDIVNAFESVLAVAQPGTLAAMERVRGLGRMPHLAGAGPSFFVLLKQGEDAAVAAQVVSPEGWTARALTTLPREQALAAEVDE